MKYHVVKIKNKDLFFNADEGMGEYVCPTPMLLDEDQANSIMKYCDKIFSENGVKYTNSDLEIREVQLSISR